MAQRSASQPTGTKRTFGRNQDKPLVILMTLIGLALAIGLTFFLSQESAQRISERQFKIDAPVAQFASTLQDDLKEMRLLEENLVLNMRNGDFATNSNEFWEPHNELKWRTYHNLAVLERALILGFDGQLSDTIRESQNEILASGAAANNIILGFAEQSNLVGNADQSADIAQQIGAEHDAYSRALFNIESNLTSVVNLAESDREVQQTALGTVNIIRNFVIAALVLGALLWIWQLLRASDEQHESDVRTMQADAPATVAVDSPTHLTSRLTDDRPFFSRIQNQLLIVFLAMVGLALAIGVTSVLSQSLARRTSARLINVDTPIAQYALDFKGDISELRRLEEAYALNVRSDDIQAATSALIEPWQAIRQDVEIRMLVLEQAMEIGFDGQLANTMASSKTQLENANAALNTIIQGINVRNELFADIEARTETISVLSVLLSFSNEKQEELRDVAQINDLSLTLLSREYLITGELSKLDEYEALVNAQFVEGDPISDLRVESVRDFKTLFALDQEIEIQRTTYARSLERIDNNLNNIIDLTLSDQAEQQIALGRTNTIAIAVIAALIVATLIPVGIYMMTSGGSTFAQIESLQNTVALVQKGDFSARAEIISNDETHIVATEMNEMLATTFSLIQSGEEQQQLQDAIMQLLEDVSDVAEGDMTIRASSQHQLTIPMAQAFNETVSQLHDLLTEVNVTTDEVDGITKTAKESTTLLTSDSEAQIGHIIDTTAAVDEMAVSIQHVSLNAARSAEVSLTAENSASQGVQAVQTTISGLDRIQAQTERSFSQINTLSEASKNISQTITLIDEISDQTSVLALNASIRALAAGDDGLGFTVVAREIEDLSTQASQAAQQVAQLTSKIQNNAVLATDAMTSTQVKLIENRRVADDALLQLQHIESVTERFSGIINEIRMVTHQQAANSEVVARSMNEITDSTKQTVTESHGTVTSLEALGVLTDELRKSIALFKLNSAETENKLASSEPGAVTA